MAVIRAYSNKDPRQVQEELQAPRLDYANEAVLPFYILHQTVMLAVGYVVLQWAIPDVLEWAIIVVISFVIIMALYEYLIRRWNVMRFLFGMKPLRRSDQPALVPAPMPKTVE